MDWVVMLALSLLHVPWDMTWRQARLWPETMVTIRTRLAAMADGDRIYLKALEAFSDHLINQGSRLTDVASADEAYHHYIVGLRRAQTEQTVLTRFKEYPPLHLSLPWPYAAMKRTGASAPTKNHPTLPWGVALWLADGLARGGYVWRSRALLSQWRWGPRPGELRGLRVDDIWLLRGLPGVTCLGRRQSLKVRRQQAICVEAVDRRTTVLLWCLVRTFPAGSALCGWTTADWHRGVQLTTPRERGRWISDGVLRLYLDAITAIDVTSQGVWSRWSLTLEHHDMYFLYYWGRPPRNRRCGSGVPAAPRIHRRVTW